MYRFFALFVPSASYLALGGYAAFVFYADIVTGRYPWGDHIPLVAVLVAAIASALHVLGYTLASMRPNETDARPTYIPARDARGRFAKR